MEEIRETPDGPALKFVHVDEVESQEVVAQMHGDRRVGVHLKFLEWTKDRMVAFTYYDPGLILERHAHESDALVFVIEGDVEVGGHPCPPGTLIVLEKGAAFGPLIAGPDGCTFLECYGDDVRPAPVDKDGYFKIARRTRHRAAAEPRVAGATRCSRAGARRRGQLVLTHVQPAATPRIVDRVSRRLLIATGLSFLVLVFAPLFLWLVEHGRSDDVHSVGDAYGWLFRTLFENTSPYKLKSQFGFLSYWTVRVAGVSLVAFATATIASRFVATVIKRGAGMGTYKGSGHILICGWSPKGLEIIRELRAKEVEDEREIVILADLETDAVRAKTASPSSAATPSNAADLLRAGLDRVSTVIVLADNTNASDEPDDLDARSLLTTLAVESINRPRTRASR